MKKELVKQDRMDPPPQRHDDSNMNLRMNIIQQLWGVSEKMMQSASPLSDFTTMLNKLIELTHIPSVAKDLVRGPWWLPRARGEDVCGRDFEFDTILGPFFRVSFIPDHYSSNMYIGGDLNEIITKNMSILHDGLARVMMSLFQSSRCTREYVLVYLAETINKNSLRARILNVPEHCSSSGMFVNLSAVMLRLCGLYLDKGFRFRDEIDFRYVCDGTRLNFRGLTTLHQVSSIMKDRREEEPGYGYSFRCELFFMTARVLHLGLITAAYEMNLLAQKIKMCEDHLLDLVAKKLQSPQLLQEIANLQEELESYRQKHRCYQLHILEDKQLIESALSFYRFMVVWLIGLVGGPKLPLPITCPKEFASMPEHLVDDVITLLVLASGHRIKLDEGLMEDFLIFIVMFMASPKYVRNPYLRAQMINVLHLWMVQENDIGSHKAFLVKQKSVLQSLTRNLLKAHVDIEFNLSDQFDRVALRNKIVQQLEYLWKVDCHHDEWIQLAKAEEKGLYLNFLKFLIDDTIFLLDKSFNDIVDIEEHGAQRMVSQRTIQLHMALALENVNLLAYTSQHITSPFLLPEIVEEVVNMLNYILSQLRKFFKLDNSRYGSDPIKLLEKIVEVYVNLERGDKYNVFAATIVKDACLYDEHLFTERIFGTNRKMKKLIEEFVQLGYKAKVAATKDTAIDEIPEEFLDPIQCTLMKDPVVLPSSQVNIDRHVITRHLLRTENDPFTRSYLSVDMLTPNVELKGKIEEFIRTKLLKQNDTDEMQY